MSPFVFLGVALGVCLFGFAFMWLRHRQPQSMEAHMREFARELDALAPDGGQRPSGPRSRPDPGQPPG